MFPIIAMLFPFLDNLMDVFQSSTSFGDDPATAQSGTSDARARGRNPLWDGLKVVLAGMFFELSRRGVQFFTNLVISGVTVTARIEDCDESYEWLYNFMAKNCALTRLDEGQLKQRYSFLTTLLEAIYPTGRAAPREVSILTRQLGRRNWMDDDDSDYDDDSCVENGGEGEVNYRLDITPIPGTYQTVQFQGKTITLGVRDELRGSHTERFMFLSTSFATHQIFNDLIRQAHKEYVVKDIGHVAFYTPNRWSDNWKRSSTRAARSWESVILPAEIKDYILADAREFVREKDFYAARGLPYRRGYLLYGVPGSGKTTLIGAIAAKLKLNVYIVSLVSKGMDDNSLTTLLSSCPPHCIVLIEDIDCAFKKRKSNYTSNDGSSSDSCSSDNEASEGKAKARKARTVMRRDGSDDSSSSDVTLSGLLNALDGVASTEGRLLFCTTNHVDHIDAALSRPGRCDVWVEFTFATKAQAKDLFLHFYLASPETVMPHPPKMVDKESDDMTFGKLSFSQRITPPATPKREGHGSPTPLDLPGLSDQFAAIIPEGVITVSALQAYLMRYKRRPDQAVQGVKEWVKGGCKQNPTATLEEGKLVMKQIRDENEGTDNEE